VGSAPALNDTGTPPRSMITNWGRRPAASLHETAAEQGEDVPAHHLMPASPAVGGTNLPLVGAACCVASPCTRTRARMLSMTALLLGTETSRPISSPSR
jgi:hypothetical protein